jgi:polyferredoxin
MKKSGRLDKTESHRLASVKNQVNLLLPRLAYLRNGILCLMLAVLFFVLTSLSIGLSYLSISTGLTKIAVNVTFMVGMLFVLFGVAFLAIEIFVSYRVMLVEVREE